MHSQEDFLHKADIYHITVHWPTPLEAPVEGVLSRDCIGLAYRLRAKFLMGSVRIMAPKRYHKCRRLQGSLLTRFVV